MKTWKVVVANPGRKAEIKEIPATYKALSDLVGGHIEMTEPVSDDTAVLCNEEEKLLRLEPNRGLYDEDGRLLDIYCGTIVCIGARPEDEDFSSLTDTEIAVYMMMYGEPEYSVKVREGAEE